MRTAAAPKRIFQSILICGASVCLFAFAPAAFAQRAGSRGGSGGGARGGSSGAAHAGMARGGGSHGGVVYGGSGVSSVHTGGAIHVAPAQMSSGGSRGFVQAGSASRSSFTRESFVAPPAAAPAAGAPVQGAARTIFINANAWSGGTPVGARPFAAGNYLWEAPPQQAHPRASAPPPVHPVVVTPPAAPQPMAMPAQQAPMRPMIVTPPSAARPIAMPARTAIPIQSPRQIPMPAQPVLHPLPEASRPIVLPPVLRPVTPLPIMRGGRFFAPPIRARRPVAPAPAPPMFHPISPTGHPMPVPPILGRMALEPGMNNTASGTFFAPRGSSGATPPHPCINTITRCGIGTGVLDGDGDFDNDGFFGPSVFFGFFGPFGFSPFGFGSTCFFNGFFQNCFLTPVQFAPFGFFGFNSFDFGPFGPFGGGWNLWGSTWGYAPYGSNLLYQPPQFENLSPAFGENVPNTNYAPNYLYEPAPEPLTEQPNTSAAAQPVVELVLKDGTVFGVTSYWLADDRLFYITTYQIQSSIPIDQLDLQKTVDMNYKRGVPFTLTPEPPANPPPQPPNPQQP